MTLAPRKAVNVPLVRVNIRDDKGTNRPVNCPIYEAPLIERVWEGYGARVEIQQMSKTGPRGEPWPEDMTQLRTSMAKEEKRLRLKYKKHPTTKENVFQSVYGLGQFPEAFQRAVEGRWVPLEKAPEPVIDDSDLIDEDDEESLDSFMAEREAKMAEEAEKQAREEAKAEAKPDDEEPSDAGEPAEATEPKREDTTAKNDDRSAQVAAMCEVKGLNTELAEAVIDTLGITSIAELSETPPDELEQVAGIGPVSAKNIVESATELALSE